MTVVATSFICFLAYLVVAVTAQSEVNGTTAEDDCTSKNPIFSCYSIGSAAIFEAGHDVPKYCRAVSEYINCTNTVACDCKLGHNDIILKEITRYMHVYEMYNCSQVLDLTLINDPGITCPGQKPTGTKENAGLMVLSLESLPNVILLEKACPGIKTCYKTLSERGGQALFTKNLKDFCSAIEDFLPCFETAACNCGHSKLPEYAVTMRNERFAYNSFCAVITKGVIFQDGIKCKGDAEYSICKHSNPIFKCFDTFQRAIRPDRSDKAVVCPVYKQYLACTESTACMCGLKSSVPVLQGLTVAHGGYESMGCESVSGKVKIQFGVNCPASSPSSGGRDDEVLTTLGLLENADVQRLIQRCPNIRQCYSNLDNQKATAIFEKSIIKMCKAQSNFINCGQEAGCMCGSFNDKPFRLFLVQQKYFHFQLCPREKSIKHVFTCGATASNQPSILFYIFICIILSYLF